MEYYQHNISFSTVDISVTDISETQTISSSLPTLINPLAVLVVQIQWHTLLIVNPIIGVTGLVGNILSAVVLVKSGLDKSSNILLLALAVADSFCLMGSINIPNLITLFPIRRPNIGYFVWEFSREISFMLYVLAITIQAFYFFGLLVSATVCTLITVERLVAVFYPLHFKTLVTPTRTWIAVIFASVFWIPCVIYFSVLNEFIYTYVAWLGMTVGYVRLNSDDTAAMVDIYYNLLLGKIIPLAVVTSGSILIAVRVYVMNRKRRDMVSMASKTSRQSSRTTTTLLGVCVCFSITKIISLIFMSFILDQTDKSVHNVLIKFILGMAVLTNDYINSSYNFVIYVLLNHKFRALLLDLRTSCRKN